VATRTCVPDTARSKKIAGPCRRGEYGRKTIAPASVAGSASQLHFCASRLLGDARHNSAQMGAPANRLLPPLNVPSIEPALASRYSDPCHRSAAHHLTDSTRWRLEPALLGRTATRRPGKSWRTLPSTRREAPVRSSRPRIRMTPSKSFSHYSAAPIARHPNGQPRPRREDSIPPISSRARICPMLRDH
jgi:hypothetical protein